MAKKIIKCPSCGKPLLGNEGTCPWCKKDVDFHKTIVSGSNVPSFNGVLMYNGVMLEKLDFGAQTVGRRSVSRPADIMINTNDMSCSRIHCLIRVLRHESGELRVTIEDMSTNGTLVNGYKLNKGDTRILFDGDKITIGNQELVYVENTKRNKKPEKTITDDENKTI